MDVEKGDGNKTILEFNWFEQNPDLGQVIFWETHGTTDNATSHYIPKTLLPNLVKTLPAWLGDHLVERTENIRTLLYTKYGQPVVIYGHCDCGCDRTGEIFGSYYMRWMGLGWEETNDLNTEIADRPMGCKNYLAMQWYCLWLNFNFQKNLNCMNPQPCTVL